MSTMSTISNEILLIIADNVTDQRDSFRLLRVCRRWHALLFLRAYRRISVSNEQIYPLVRCIYSNPKIGAAIKDLNISGWKRVQSLNTMWKWQRMPSGKAVTPPENTYHGTAVTVLCLEFSMSSVWFIPMMERAAFRDPPFDENPVLEHLERVTVQTEDNKTVFDATEFLPVFQLPAMRVFSAHAVSELQPYESISIYPKPSPGTSGIRELRLGGILARCNGSQGMYDYITACASLETFEYQHDNTAIWGQYSLSFQPGAFYTALLTQKQSLRELRLNDNGDNKTDGCDNELDKDDYFNRFGSLVEFNQLRELRIPVRTLLEFGHGDRPEVSLPDVLPSGLEYLHLADYHREDFDVVMADLKRVVTQRTERFSNLTKIRLQSSGLERVPRSPSGWRVGVPLILQQAFEPLTELCREAGIDFCVCKPEWADE
ncbi:hypothetical protein N7486_008327 [Penicillium sp. IBT 16267x]|nr:hypothetical protein N7486_008327 [Penicillium sp. IBT 16267x]